jgi:adenine-specific DNA-methyltransferase
VVPAEFDVTAKWRSLITVRSRQHTTRLVPFSALARIMRGIATGANHFFSLSQAEVDEWGLEDRFLRPCLTKAQQVPGLDFTHEDFESLRRANKKVWLLHCTAAPSFAVAAYLREGERRGLHQRYLTHHRTPWYAPEQRDVAPVLVTVFGRAGLRFVLNRAEVWNLTACHCVYPNFDDPTLLSALMAYLTSPLAAEKLALELRAYGDGLLKVEPRDVLRLPVLDVCALPRADAAELATLFDELCRQQRFEPPETMAETRARIGEILGRYVG